MARIVRKKDGTPDLRYKNAYKVPIKKAVVRKEIYTHSVRGNRVTIARNARIVGSAEVNVASTNISCGVKQVNGVWNLERLYNQGVPHATTNAAITALLTAIKRMYKAAFLVMSNNNRSTYINALLDKIATVSTAYVRNPGTGNQIKVWTF